MTTALPTASRAERTRRTAAAVAPSHTAAAVLWATETPATSQVLASVAATPESRPTRTAVRGRAWWSSQQMAAAASRRTTQRRAAVPTEAVGTTCPPWASLT